MGNPVFMILWLLILVFISFFVAFFCSAWYILFHCLASCIPAIQGLADVLLGGINFPRYCADKMLKGDGFP